MIAKGTRLYNVKDKNTYEILRTEALKKVIAVHYRCIDCKSGEEDYIITTNMQTILKGIEFGDFVEVK